MKDGLSHDVSPSAWKWNRSSVEDKLDQIIRENRFTIAVIFPLVGAVILIASAEGWLPPFLAFNPLLVIFGVLIMRSPLLSGIAPLISYRAIVGLGLLTIYTYVIEYIGVQTAWPYGEFVYGVSLGPMIGGIPVALPLFFIPLAMNAYLLFIRIVPPRINRLSIRLLGIIPLVVILDIVLDPAAVALGFWLYPDGGVFYGVPLSNYMGWVLSATIAVVLIDLSFQTDDLRDRSETCPYILDDLVSFVILWGIINLWFGYYMPVIVAILVGFLIAYSIIFRQHLDHDIMTIVQE